PPRRGDRSRPILDEQQRWQQLNRCLHDDTMPLAVRVVGALTLLFGLTTSRLLQLTVNDVILDDDTVHLAIGPSPIELPRRVGDLVRRQLAHASSIDLNAPELPRWLLPAHLGTLPVNPAHMSDLLTAADIDARDGHHAALVDLAAALPPAVLASLLGVHINTAIAW